MAAAAASSGQQHNSGAWRALGTPPTELRLDFTLPTGQSFRWRKTGENEYTGVIGGRLVRLRQEANDVLYQVLSRVDSASAAEDQAAIADYFNLRTSLTELVKDWSARDARFRAVSPYFTGARMLRQDPLECLLQFICSSNNHISRIHGMVHRLTAAYGTPLLLPRHAALASSPPAPATPAQPSQPLAYPPTPSTSALPSTPLPARPVPAQPPAATDAPLYTFLSQPSTADSGSLLADDEAACTPQPTAVTPDNQQQQEAEEGFYVFPTLDQLAVATEQELRDMGFGYRAKFIVGAVQALRERPEGGDAWLMGLRQAPAEEAVAALEQLPGVGPKVAACVALFSLDKHELVPVDTHVWKLVVKYYAPRLAGKTLTKAIHAEVARVFVDLFGCYAGWAHNTLFISQLASMRHHLPASLHPRGTSTSPKSTASAATSDLPLSGTDSEPEPHTPPATMEGWSTRRGPSGGRRGRAAGNSKRRRVGAAAVAGQGVAGATVAASEDTGAGVAGGARRGSRQRRPTQRALSAAGLSELDSGDEMEQ